MDKQLLLSTVLAAYREIAPAAALSGVFLMERLAQKLYEKGARVVIGGPMTLIERTIHHSIDPDQRLVWTCKDWNRTLGYRAGAMIGHHISEVLTPDSYAFIKDSGWPELLHTGKLGPVAMTLVGYDGATMPAMLKSEMLRDSDGAFQRTFAKLRCQIVRAP